MLRGIYTAAAGMLATNMSMDTLANNLANVNTVGFKTDKVNFQSFPEMLMQKVSGMGNKTIGSINTGSQLHGTYVNYTEGAAQVTGNPFDVAIQGDGFFAVKAPQGKDIFYTRAGNFTVSGDGYLTTANGMRVQGKNGDIQVNLENGPFKFNEKGALSDKDQVVAELDVTRFTKNQSLEKVTENLYKMSSISQKMPDGSSGYSIQQGALEGSNVNPISELVNNIQGQRLYEALQKNIHLSNETLDKAVNDVGRSK